jgi:nucleotide-binding universal stress UspA family protein
MSYRSVLAYVDGSDAAHAAISAAVHIARDHEAQLTGLHVVAPAMLPGDNRLRLTPEIMETLARRRHESAERAEHLFRGATATLGRTAWELAEFDGSGDLPALVSRRARCFDLAVIGQVGEGETVGRRPGALPEQLVLQSGRPILVVPPVSAPATIGHRVLVAWDQSREAARALTDALPILKRAERVWILTIGEAEDTAAFAADGKDQRAERAVAYLAEHGVTAVPLHDTVNELDASEILLARASDSGADLLVLGAYGHSRLRELVLGGVTREILTHLTIPALLSH